jgi:hypothetical protein
VLSKILEGRVSHQFLLQQLDILTLQQPQVYAITCPPSAFDRLNTIISCARCMPLSTGEWTVNYCTFSLLARRFALMGRLGPPLFCICNIK